MADLAPQRIPINDIEISNDAPVTAATNVKIGGAINDYLAKTSNYVEFLANGNWTAPDANGDGNPFLLVLHGSGGGGGGGSSDATSAGGGGGGAPILLIPVLVTPGIVYPITIGAGGAGGVSPNSGSNGGNTTFGSLATFYGGAGGLTRNAAGLGYLGDGLERLGNSFGFGTMAFLGSPGGAAGWEAVSAVGRPGVNSVYALGGAGGDNGLGGNGGGGGGAAWGAGGIGHGDTIPGTAAAANSGAGGGGFRISAGNNGYAGGSGRLRLYWYGNA